MIADDQYIYVRFKKITKKKKKEKKLKQLIN